MLYHNVTHENVGRVACEVGHVFDVTDMLSHVEDVTYTSRFNATSVASSAGKKLSMRSS